ncbi:MAG: hypothetical protein L0J24_09865, partial [Corynebacterium flavescens]|uniref:reverse transcriptase domain-containing protein n=1 Tax=Corynebacterium flavescens TaxID=28028 RepID=UPI0026499C80
EVNAEETREVKMAFAQTGQTLGSTTVALSIASLQIHEEETKFEVAPLFEDVMGILSFEWQRRHRVHLSWEDMEYYVEPEPAATTVATLATEGSIGGITTPQKHDEHEIQALGKSPSVPCADESQPAIDLDEALSQMIQHDFARLFEPPGPPPSRPWDHTIKTTTEEGFWLKDWPRSPKEHEAIRAFVEDALQRDLIEEAPPGAWQSRLLLIPKPDGTYRVTVDYRTLNKVTVKDHYPLTRVDDTFAMLNGAKYFSTIDLKDGFWQIRLHPDSRHKTAFVTRQGVYQWKVMPMGISSAPSAFQRAMVETLSGLMDRICTVYLDDIVIWGCSKEEHLNNVYKVLSALAREGFHLSAKKCRWGLQELKYLGHIISAEGVRPDPAKVEALDAWKMPHTLKTLRSFLGAASYYRAFIEGYAALARPLTDILRTGEQYTKKLGKTVFKTSPEAEQAFQLLRGKLRSAPLLAYPDINRPFILDTDASDEAMGAVLQQAPEDVPLNPDEPTERSLRNLRPVAYFSKRLTETQSRYSVQEKEALAIVAALEKFRGMIEGARIIVRTDHESLKYLRTAKDLPRRMRKFVDLIEGFDPLILYRRGKDNHMADYLSRTPPTEPSKTDGEIDKDALDLGYLFATRDAEAGQASDDELSEEDEPDEGEEPCQADEAPPDEEQEGPLLTYAFAREMYDTLLDDLDHIDSLEQNPGYFIDRNSRLALLMDDGSTLTLPQSPEDAEMLIKDIHAKTGHYGVANTVIQAERRLGMEKKEIVRIAKQVVRECIPCQKAARVKTSSQRQQVLHHLPDFDIFDMWAVDLVGPMNQVQGCKYIICAVEYATGYAFVRALPDKQATRVVDFLNELGNTFGIPKNILPTRVPSSSTTLSSTTAPHTASNTYVPRLTTLRPMVAWNGLTKSCRTAFASCKSKKRQPTGSRF